MDWHQLKCHFSQMKNVLFTVIAALDQYLEKGMTYIYLMMQTDQLEITAISATPISVP